ncbi:hypothetical protein Rhopal_006690-T1 [Rhodotorula paludigena]|uniref:ASTRA-associated protein 1 n=1 Tax=Rhodotorula paludigena TaxID=86838 RepID=A0AAV5GTU1_9BASI|nr:hypothetical protein Rhopal_006690-T1 [Rhodotorula paludigena]
MAQLSSPALRTRPRTSPPEPWCILRAHAAPLSVVHFSACTRILYTADTDGFVAAWNLATRRPLCFWKAHEAGVLGLEEHDGGLLTQGRDNIVHHYRFPSKHATSAQPTRSLAVSGPATAVPSPSNPSTNVQRVWSLDINAMNFCRMSLCPLGSQPLKGQGEKAEEQVEEDEALVAVPSLTKDEVVDIFYLPSKARAHRSVGAGAFIGSKTGTVMAVHLFHLPASTASVSPSSPSVSSTSTPEPVTPASLHLLIAYESGQLALFRFTPTRSFEHTPSRNGDAAWMPREGTMVEESEGWELVWVEKGHRDAVMSLAVSRDLRFAYTVGADHFIAKYRIFDLNDKEAALPRMHVEGTTQAGKAAVAVRSDGRLLATAGWDGELRLYSAKTLQPLAVLSHHRTALQSLSFAPLAPHRRSTTRSSEALLGGDAEDEEEGEGDGGGEEGRAWLAAGGQEGKVSLWSVYPPQDSR